MVEEEEIARRLRGGMQLSEERHELGRSFSLGAGVLAMALIMILSRILTAGLAPRLSSRRRRSVPGAGRAVPGAYSAAGRP